MHVSSRFISLLCFTVISFSCNSVPDTPKPSPQPASSASTAQTSIGGNIDFPPPPSLKYDVLGDESLHALLGDRSEPAVRKRLQKQGAFVPNKNLQLCGGTVSNAPDIDSSGYVKNYAEFIDVDGVTLAMAPVNDTCLSSSFGPRWGRQHKGIDLASRENAPAYAAASGRIISARYSRSFGNVVLMKHSDTVFTRYAHLDIIDNKVQVGRTFGAGQPLGLIGRTGIAQGIHLHYEVLIANGGNKPIQVNPFDYPKALLPQRVSKQTS